MSAALPITPGAVNEWVAVAASQTDAPVTKNGVAGGVGDYIDGILVIPTSTAAGAVTLKDNTTAIGGNALFDGGAVTALTTLVPFYIPVGARSRNGGWTITTGANVRCVACGTFSS